MYTFREASLLNHVIFITISAISEYSNKFRSKLFMRNHDPHAPKVFFFCLKVCSSLFCGCTFLKGLSALLKVCRINTILLKKSFLDQFIKINLFALVAILRPHSRRCVCISLTPPCWKRNLISPYFPNKAKTTLSFPGI